MGAAASAAGAEVLKAGNEDKTIAMTRSEIHKSAEFIVEVAGVVGGIVAVRRLAEWAWPEDVQLKDDSPELRAAIQTEALRVVAMGGEHA